MILSVKHPGLESVGFISRSRSFNSWSSKIMWCTKLSFFFFSELCKWESVDLRHLVISYLYAEIMFFLYP